MAIYLINNNPSNRIQTLDAPPPHTHTTHRPIRDQQHLLSLYTHTHAHGQIYPLITKVHTHKHSNYMQAQAMPSVIITLIWMEKYFPTKTIKIRVMEFVCACSDV